MTQAGFLPGQPPIGYGLTPGVHHNVSTMRDDMTGDPEPVEPAPLPGGGAVLPEKIDLDAPEGQPAAPALAKPPEADPIGWRIKNKDGSVLAEFHNVNTQDYQKEQVKKIGQSLVDQAVTPADKEAAGRALAYGLAMVGIAPVAEIGKRMAARYDTDQRNDISRSIQAQKTARSAARGGGGGGPAGPSKQDKFDNSVDQFDSDLTEKIVNNEQAQAKVASLHDMESDLDKLETMLNSGNPMAERGAIMEYMKTLSGKQSTDAERRQLANANGIIDSLINNVSLWTNDPGLTSGYVKQFKSLVRTLRAAVTKRKSEIGRQASERIQHQPRFAGKDPETKKRLGQYAQGVVTGDYGDQQQPGAVPAPHAGVDPDLVK